MNQNISPKRPSVVVWYKIYCVFTAMCYLMFAVYIAFLIWLPKEQIISRGKLAGGVVSTLEHMWGSLLAGTILLTLFLIVALFLPKKSWVWVYGIVAICIGLPNCCCLPLSIPVLIYWFRPETKQYFGWPDKK